MNTESLPKILPVAAILLAVGALAWWLTSGPTIPLKERIPGAEYACVPAAGHVANVEQPLAFNGALVSFLKRNFD